MLKNYDSALYIGLLNDAIKDFTKHGKDCGWHAPWTKLYLHKIYNLCRYLIKVPYYKVRDLVIN